MTSTLDAGDRVRLTAMARPPWEQGSDFHLPLEIGIADLPWAPHPHGLWGSGREALRDLMAWGTRTRGWRRLMVPSYFCHNVLAAIERETPVIRYPSAPAMPTDPGVETREGDIVLVVATFGIPPSIEVSGPGVVVEDHTHDPTGPGAAASHSDYAFASLRKALPLPDGGVLWSPRDLPVPAEPPLTTDHTDVVLRRLSAMALKLHHLTGGKVDREAFRSLSIEAEEAIGAGPVSGISAFSRARLPTLPTQRWRAARARNLEAFREALSVVPGVTLLDAPFAATLVFRDRALRDAVRNALIASRIYPAVLWQIDAQTPGIPEAHVDLAGRILSVHCDHRYGPDDMARVARRIRGVMLP